jgi:hypothetical protein
VGNISAFSRREKRGMNLCPAVVNPYPKVKPCGIIIIIIMFVTTD